MDTGLAERVALVTGGAGGIGTAVCRALAAEGARVVVHHHTRGEQAARLVGELPGGAGRHLSAGADLTDERAVAGLFAEIEGRFGRCDVLVANAGHWPAQDLPVADLDLARWNATLAANLTASFLSCREMLRLVRRTGGPEDASIVLIGSTAGLFGEAGHADYAAAKAALHDGFARSLKNEMTAIAPRGRVNTVRPGWTVTDKNRHRLDDPAVVRRVEATRPLRGVARPEDIAAAVVFLASSKLSGHMTGEAVTVAGGMEGRLLR
jgi:3-oxoacyl-[acyl-carrier protein] reductase